MRFEVNVECTPEEARQFFGLPDILPMQKDLMDMVSRRLSENIQTMEPDKLVKTWLPAMFQSWSDMQQNFWNQMGDVGGKINPMSAMESLNPLNPLNAMGMGAFKGGASSAKDKTTAADKASPKRKR
ncbi:MAG: hypothetical protein JNK24_03880 [Alphaproteobacteria bacterium]|nr:hypothetical protein [Alphaproteobacteria bacterium]